MWLPTDFVGVNDDAIGVKKAKAAKQRKNHEAKEAYADAAPAGSTVDGKPVMVNPELDDDDAPDHIKAAAAAEGISIRSVTLSPSAQLNLAGTFWAVPLEPVAKRQLSNGWQGPTDCDNHR